MTTNGHQTHIYIGLAGEGDAIGQGGMIRRTAGDSEWQSIAKGLPENPQVRALAIHPDNPAVIFAGTQDGPYRSDDRGEHWEALGRAESRCLVAGVPPGQSGCALRGVRALRCCAL